MREALCTWSEIVLHESEVELGIGAPSVSHHTWSYTFSAFLHPTWQLVTLGCCMFTHPAGMTSTITCKNLFQGWSNAFLWLCVWEHLFLFDCTCNIVEGVGCSVFSDMVFSDTLVHHHTVAGHVSLMIVTRHHDRTSWLQLPICYTVTCILYVDVLQFLLFSHKNCVCLCFVVAVELWFLLRSGEPRQL